MHGSPIRERAVVRAVVVVVGVSLYTGAAAMAGHMSDWSHDHSKDGIPPGQSAAPRRPSRHGRGC